MSEQEKSLEDFARDACARAMLESPYHGSAPGELDEAIGKTARAVAARVREECAVLCESLTPKRIKNDYDAGEDFALERAAAAIRAMNEASHG